MTQTIRIINPNSNTAVTDGMSAPPEHPGEVLIGGWTPRLGRL